MKKKIKELKKIQLPQSPKEEEIMKLEKEEAIKVLMEHIKEVEKVATKVMDNIEELLEKYLKEMAKNKIKDFNKYVSKSEKNEIIIVNEVEEDIEKEKKSRKSPKEKFAKELEKLITEPEEVIDYDFEGKGIDRKKVKKIGEDSIIKIEVKETPFKVVRVVRPKYADKENIYQELSTDVFPGSVLTPSLAANIIMFKYALSVPLNRYGEYMERFGIKIPRNNLSNYVKRASEKLMPIYEEIKEVVVNADVLHCDETTLTVQEEKERNKCYMFVYRTGKHEDRQASLYVFNEDRKTEKTKELLRGKRGYLNVDGYQGYDKLENNMEKQRCWAHIRRKFVDCVKAIPKGQRSKSKANEIVELIGKLYVEERKFKVENKSPEEIKELRNSEKYKTILKEIDERIEKYNSETKIESNLKSALGYYLNIKKKKELYTFLEDGRIEIDNNLAERTIKPFTIGRKNFMFCKTKNGAEVTSLMYSIVQTCFNNGINPEEYIKYVLEEIDKKDIGELVPWNDDIKEKFSILKVEKN